MLNKTGGNPYADPALAEWMGGFEGMYEWPHPVESAKEKEARAAWQNRLYAIFGAAGQFLPGLLLATVVAFAGGALATWLGSLVWAFDRSPVSAVLVTILVGFSIRNVIGLPEVYEKGIGLCVKRLLRLGIMLLGLRLSLATAGMVGLRALPVVLVCIFAALVLVTQINRVFGLPRRLGSLIAVGTGICGVSAVVATGPIINAEKDEISYAIACVTIFGMVGLFVYPFAAHWMFGEDPVRVGQFLGTAIHDTAQVAGAGLLYSERFGAPQALESATVTKLVRNLFMIGVIPLMAFLYRRDSNLNTLRPSWYEFVPLFVIGFVALAAARSLGDLYLPAVADESWASVLSWASRSSSWLLVMAMAGVGLGTSISNLRGIGLRPMSVGFVAAALVGGVSALLVTFLGAR
jgi:uncharacterized integral membrane protein (TIGR00698 family)